MDRAIAYAVLEISAEATPEEVRAAYRRRAFATHPDRGSGDAAAFQAVSDAYRSLSDPALHRAQEPGPASGPDTSTQVPPTDAAKVLFEYLSDLASDMILNGATPEMVVSFLAREGCPESVARALERELRDRVQPAPGDPPAAPGFAEPPAAAPPVVPSAARPPARPFPTRLTVAVAAAAVVACILGASLMVRQARSPARTAEVAPPAAVAAAPNPPSAPAPARPPRSAPARPSAQQVPRPPARERETSPRGTTADLDAERAALEADQRRFDAEVAELEAERGRIDAEEAALASAPDVERYASLTPRKAAYNARVEMARRTERALQRRVRDLNAEITAHNDRVRSGR